MITLRPGSQTWRLLHILVATTEYPARSLHLLGSGRYYEALIHRLETPQEFRSADGTVLGRFKVLNVSGRHEKRTIRLNKAALPLLTHLHPNALDYYMAASGGHRFSGNSDHILRNHRVAESLVLCMASGAMALPYQLPPLQKSIIQHTVPTSPSFYIAREVKKLEKTELSKTIFTRLTGALFSHGTCFAVYNTRDSVMKWSGMGEFKTANHLTEVARMNAGVDRVDRALLLGQGNNVALTTLLSSANRRRMDLRFDRIYPHIHFIPMDRQGVRLLRLLLQPDWQEQLLSALFPPELRPDTPGSIECDAKRGDILILSHLDGDLARLLRLKQALEHISAPVELLCFPWQTPFLREYLGNRVQLRELAIEMLEDALDLDPL